MAKIKTALLAAISILAAKPIADAVAEVVKQKDAEKSDLIAGTKTKYDALVAAIASGDSALIGSAATEFEAFIGDEETAHAEAVAAAPAIVEAVLAVPEPEATQESTGA
jgi:hypothetical protein